MALTFFDVGSRRTSRWMVRYAAAVVVATAALLLTRDMGPLFERAQFFLALSGVIVTAWYCGRGPAFTTIMMALDGTDVERLTTNGSYNDDPAWAVP